MSLAELEQTPAIVSLMKRRESAKARMDSFVGGEDTVDRIIADDLEDGERAAHGFGSACDPLGSLVPVVPEEVAQVVCERLLRPLSCMYIHIHTYMPKWCVRGVPETSTMHMHVCMYVCMYVHGAGGDCPSGV